MTTNISEVQHGQRPVAPGLSALAEQLVAERAQDVELTGPGGLLTGLTKQVLEKDKYPAMVAMWERPAEHLDRVWPDNGRTRNTK